MLMIRQASLAAAFAASILLSVSPGAAANFSTVITDLEANVITVDGKPDGAPLTLKTVATSALLGVFTDEQSLPQDEKARAEKLRRFNLAVTISKAGDKDLWLPAADVALLETLIGKMYVPLVFGRAFELLEAKPK